MSDGLHERIHMRDVQARLFSHHSRLHCKHDSFSQRNLLQTRELKNVARDLKSTLSTLDDSHKLELTRMRK
jgi:hypothetical protein